ncbi:hypothetical protein SCHPADRAFT_992919 [Schizopora paradoxa]|uniref:Uncharacterized protein n=1 Tax=Schizopora paradoxa TaxID=27342 RepID=A0A0H2SBP6_9AGAM|nr:hypothetical protein SCHPADRAFT_992919 [Schizopora paradoxa]
MARSIANGTFSPPPPVSSTASQSNGVTTKLNIVSRLAIDGKAKQSLEGAHVHLYLKLNIALDAVTPSQILPIFAEEGVKLKDHQVHPLDAESAPYDFSLKENPMLNKAARALNLPGRSTRSYLSLFEGRGQQISNHSSKSVVPELEQRYSGYIIVSGYNICFVLPKEFPPTSRPGSDGNAASLSRSGRRSSILGRASLQYMVALDLWVPFSSKPPKAPYMVSIPIPRCLSNTIKFRIFSPSSMTTSFASLSSDEEAGGWDVATVPHVNRTAMKHSTRPNAYSALADDESSESSLAGLYDNCLVQGTFTSTDRISIRWATPLRGELLPKQSDGRRRAQVGSMKSTLTCTILERVPDGVKLRLDYQGICSNIWFPGVATQLGLDILLDNQGCQVDWPSIGEGQWSIDGDPAMAGFNIGPPRGTLSRQSSLELPTMTIATNGHSRSSTQDDIRTIPSQSGSTASLLRIPIPSQATTEYSFEDTPLMTPATSDMPTSVASLTPFGSRSSSLANAFPSETEHERKQPTTPITLHINMNELPPSPKNKFTFNVSGTVTITRPPATSESQYSVSTSSDNASIQLPMFRVISCDQAEENTYVRNQCDGANVELVNSGTGGSTISQDKREVPRRKVVVSPGSQTKCGLEYSEIIVAPLQPSSPVKLEESLTPLDNRIASPVSRPSSSRSNHQDRKGKSRVDSPAIVPWVVAKISPLSSDEQLWSYAGTLSLPTPVSDKSQWIEIGFAMPSSSLISVLDISIICTSISGVPVLHETLGKLREAEKDEFDDSVAEKQRWVMWVRVNVAFQGTLDIVYAAKISKSPKEIGKKDKKRGKEESICPLFLPHFFVPVARLQVDVGASTGTGDYELRLLNDNNQVMCTSQSVCDFALKPLGTPQVALSHARALNPTTRRSACSWLFASLPLAMLWLIAVMSLLQSESIHAQLRDIRQWQAMVESSYVRSSGAKMAPLEVTKFVTMTVTKTSSTFSMPTNHIRSSAETTSSSSSSSTSPPTIILSSSVSKDEKQSETQTTSLSESNGFSMDLSALVPSIYVPLKWQAQIQVEDLKKYFDIGWKRFKRLTVVILHWPLPVPEDTP